jgi:hypothetical protein
MGKIHNPHLAQRVDSILLRMLDFYLKDPEIASKFLSKRPLIRFFKK